MIHADFWGSLILMGLSVMAFIGGWQWRGLWDARQRRRARTRAEIMQRFEAQAYFPSTELRDLLAKAPPAIPPGEGVK